jgi:8-oxo-dGTP pyrophosphatase MutT (NUDIX family)
MIIDDSWYVRPEGVPDRLVAGGVIVRRENDTLFLALVTENKAQTYYLLPKGGVEAGESLEEAARREIREEAGLNELQFHVELGVTERLEFNKKTWCTAHYFLFSTHQTSGHPTDKEKVYTLEWFSLDHLPDFFWPDQKALVEENKEKIMSLLHVRNLSS